MFEKLDLDSKLSYEFYNYFTKINKSWVLYPEVQLVLKKISKKYNIFLISNFDKDLKNILNKLKINSFFKDVYISQSVNLEKPSKKFYKKFFNKNKLYKSNSIYIGDNYNLDYKPVSKMGYKVFLLDRDNLYQKKYTIKSLKFLESAI